MCRRRSVLQRRKRRRWEGTERATHNNSNMLILHLAALLGEWIVVVFVVLTSCSLSFGIGYFLLFALFQSIVVHVKFDFN